MLANLLDSWSIIQYGIQGFLIPVKAAFEILFTMPFLPFTILGIITICFKKRLFR